MCVCVRSLSLPLSLTVFLCALISDSRTTFFYVCVVHQTFLSSILNPLNHPKGSQGITVPKTIQRAFMRALADHRRH